MLRFANNITTFVFDAAFWRLKVTRIPSVGWLLTFLAFTFSILQLCRRVAANSPQCMGPSEFLSTL